MFVGSGRGRCVLVKVQVRVKCGKSTSSSRPGGLRGCLCSTPGTGRVQALRAEQQGWKRGSRRRGSRLSTAHRDPHPRPRASFALELTARLSCLHLAACAAAAHTCRLRSHSAPPTGILAQFSVWPALRPLNPPSPSPFFSLSNPFDRPSSPVAWRRPTIPDPQHPLANQLHK